MKKLFIFLASLSVSSIIAVNCKKKEIKPADLDALQALKIGSYGEYCASIGRMSPEKLSEYQAKLKGGKVSWTVNAIGGDKNDVTRSRYKSRNVLEIGDPSVNSRITLCYTDDDVKKINPNNKIIVSGIIVFNYGMLDLYPCTIKK
jgi:hypothetical protein